jgi:hypothetical protein
MESLSKPIYETLSLTDGTTLQVTKQPSMGQAEWEEMKDFLEKNPEEARRLENQAKDSQAMREMAQINAIQEFYESKVAYGDDAFTSKLSALERNPDFAPIFDDIKQGGVPAAMQYYYNEPLMLKMNRAVGGLPEEVKDKLTVIQKTPVTVHEACKMGDIKALEGFFNSPGSWDPDDKDAKGITCLGYAVGANRPGVVKMLLDKKASLNAVDTSGNSALHYAAAYGRTEMVKFLAGSCKVDATNTSGQTPLALATKNKMTEAADALKAKGAR